MNDNYFHKDITIIYITESIPGPSDDSTDFECLLSNFNSQISSHCTCDSMCTQNCDCLKRSGGPNYELVTDDAGTSYRLKREVKDMISYPVMECNSLCKCSQDCGNRVVQKGPLEGLKVALCSIKAKGLGLFTTNPIPKGTFICEYAGEVITRKQALQRHRKNGIEKKMNYIFCLNEKCNGVQTQTFIDPSRFGNIGRYINHSCNPNCVVVPVRVDIPIPKLAIFSNQHILSGTELSFDYSAHTVKSLFSSSADLEKYLNQSDSKLCLCNDSNCEILMPSESYEKEK